MNSPPNDVRHFVHGRLKRAVTGFVTSGFNPLAAVGGFISPDAPTVLVPPSRRIGGAPTPFKARRRGGRRGGAKTAQFFNLETGDRLGSCPGKLKRDKDGVCRFPGSPADISIGGAMGGEVIMGRYGAAMAPMTDSRIVRDCLPGMVLGDDNNCYNKRDIRNSERKWPKGRRPLGTPGEMAALSKAAAFGRRMESTVKRMQKIGVLKKPSRRSAPRPRQKLIGPGSPSIINVE